MADGACILQLHGTGDCDGFLNSAVDVSNNFIMDASEQNKSFCVCEVEFVSASLPANGWAHGDAKLSMSGVGLGELLREARRLDAVERLPSTNSCA